MITDRGDLQASMRARLKEIDEESCALQRECHQLAGMLTRGEIDDLLSIVAHDVTAIMLMAKRGECILRAFASEEPDPPKSNLVCPHCNGIDTVVRIESAGRFDLSCRDCGYRWRSQA